LVERQAGALAARSGLETETGGLISPAGPKMKPILALLAAFLVGAVAASWVTSQRAAERRKAELARASARWETERASLEAALAERLKQAPSAIGSLAPTRPEEAAVLRRTDPASCLDRLLSLRPQPGPARRRFVRQVVHELETLVEAGPPAVPVIERLLASNEDRSYAPDAAQPPASPRAFPEGRPPFPQPLLPAEPATAPALPASLRLGLFDCLRFIGGEVAERVLAEALRSGANGGEVSHLALLLEELAPGKYRDLALATARDLLLNSPADPEPGSANPPAGEGVRRSLFQVLVHFQDPSLVPAALDWVVRPDGPPDYPALEYLAVMDPGRLEKLRLDHPDPALDSVLARARRDPHNPGNSSPLGSPLPERSPTPPTGPAPAESGTVTPPPPRP